MNMNESNVSRRELLKTGAAFAAVATFASTIGRES